jgi:hypothetical protein
MEHINNHSIEALPYEELQPASTLPATEVNSNEVDERQFITANTTSATLQEIQAKHIIPVFVKDNETLISHVDFIEAAQHVALDVYNGETILKPSIRVSHPIKGRVPEARNKKADQLLEHEKTLFYERMAFTIEIPTVTDIIGGNTLSLTIGGVKAYNLDNLYSKKGSDEHFKIFIGFQNRVCTNLCVWTDGFKSDVRVQGKGQLKGVIRTLVENYNANYHLHNLKRLVDYSITESQFAHLIGRLRMFNYLPADFKSSITSLSLGDAQINAVVKDYYKYDSFCRNSEGNINLWKLYNLFTGSNKSSYIDTFLDRTVNAFDFTDQIRLALDNKFTNWFLN